MNNFEYENHLGFFRIHNDRVEYSFEGGENDEWRDAYTHTPEADSFGNSEFLFLAWCAIRAHLWGKLESWKAGMVQEGG